MYLARYLEHLSPTNITVDVDSELNISGCREPQCAIIQSMLYLSRQCKEKKNQLPDTYERNGVVEMGQAYWLLETFTRSITWVVCAVLMPL